MVVFHQRSTQLIPSSTTWPLIPHHRSHRVAPSTTSPRSLSSSSSSTKCQDQARSWCILHQLRAALDGFWIDACVGGGLIDVGGLRGRPQRCVDRRPASFLPAVWVVYNDSCCRCRRYSNRSSRHCDSLEWCQLQIAGRLLSFCCCCDHNDRMLPQRLMMIFSVHLMMQFGCSGWTMPAPAVSQNVQHAADPRDWLHLKIQELILFNRALSYSHWPLKMRSKGVTSTVANMKMPRPAMNSYRC